MFGRTVRGKLILAFGFVIAVILFLAVFSIALSQRYLRESLGESSVLLAEAVVRSMNHALQTRLVGIRQLGASASVQDSLSASNAFFAGVDDPIAYVASMPGQTARELLDRELAAAVERRLVETHKTTAGHLVYYDAAVINRHGIAVAQDATAPELEYADQEWFKLASRTGQYVGPAGYDEALGITGLPVAVRILDEQGAFAGVMKSGLSLEEIARKSVVTGNRRETAQARIVTLEGRLVFSTRAFGFLEDVSNREYFRNIKGETGYFIAEEGGRKVLFSYAGNAGSGPGQAPESVRLSWIVILGHDVREILKPVSSLRTIMSSASLALVLLCVAILFMVSRQVTRPVAALTRGAEIVRSGDISHRIEVRSRDEIGTLAAAFNEMLDKLEEQTDSLKRLSSELEIIVDGVPGRVFYKDTENRYVRVNKFEAGAHKLDKKDMEGKSCFELYPREQAQAYLEDDLQVIRSGQAKLSFDEPWQTEQGTRWVSTTKIPRFDEQGKAVGIIGVSIDITERRQAEVEVREKSEQLERRNWIRTGEAELNLRLRGEKDLDTLSREVITFLAEYCGATIGALFLAAGGHLELHGRYAYRKSSKVPERFAFGEGLVGQAAADGKTHLLTEVPSDYITIGSAFGQTPPKSILVLPFRFADRVKGVIELGSLDGFSDLQREYLESVAESIAIAFHTAQAREELKSLLAKTQEQAAELQTQQEELRVSNEELEEQTQRLQASEEQLRVQQEELQVSNEELEEKNEILERQRLEVEQARKKLEDKAQELALASKYKSEFLANMSHELRTPLNSLLLLAQSLAENKQGNLSAEQAHEAEVIHASGNDLLNLINEILDLSKIEAGRMELQPATVGVSELAAAVRTSFDRLAEHKGLAVAVEVAAEVPEHIVTDRKRLEQVIKNLVSNAIKFTESGKVTVRFDRPGGNEDLSRSGLIAEQAFSIAVSDTGIGIAPQQQKIIFEAFQQADGGTSRKYGGTGLGLSISREMVQLLGGEIRLESEPGRGSTFTVFLPVVLGERAAQRSASNEIELEVPPPDREGGKQRQVPSLEDDRRRIGKKDTVILVVEDDERFAGVLRDKCHEKGFKCLAAATGEEGLELASKYLPHGVILDIRLPGMDGLAVLDALKEDMRTRHIPVHIVSVEEVSAEALRKGAVGYAVKPLSREDLEGAFRKIEQVSPEKPRRVLVVEDNEEIRAGVVRLIRDRDVEVDEAGSGEQAMKALRAGEYGCLILDLGLPDMDGGEFLDRLRREGTEIPPVIVHTARDLSREQEMDLREHAQSVVVKDARSPERLLDEVSLFLHQQVNRMPGKKRQIIRNLHQTDELLKDKKVLIVDDDMRTVFALSRLLAERGMKPLKAENGEKALRLLEQEGDVDLVLMDVMMPVMDGYETMRRIRESESFCRLPIIALTAKAMKEDRRRCLEAGASDYLPKPVDSQRLVSMMRVWLYR